MQITAKLIRKYRWQNRLFYLLFSLTIVLTAMLSEKYQFISDWTRNNQNSLNEKTQTLLQLLNEPIQITSYTNNSQIKKVVKRLITRYQQIYPDIHLNFIDPVQDPQSVRELGIQVDGELILQIADRNEHLTQLNESNLTNAILRLTRQSMRKIYFVAGHGERRPFGKANFDLSEFSQQLQKQGFELSSIKLSEMDKIDVKNDVLIIAGPQSDFLSGEVEILLQYIERGVNLLWLLDPLKQPQQGQYLFGLEALAERLGIEFSDGVVVDSTTKTLQLERPDYAIIGDYLAHPLTASMQNLTIFPQAMAIDPMPTDDDENPHRRFSFDVFLLTIEESWTETSDIIGSIQYDAEEDTLGPLIIGVSQSRLLPEINSVEIQTTLHLSAATVAKPDDKAPAKQRVVVIGDGDFLSNAFVANGGNLELGLNILNWLSQDDQLIAIPAKEKVDIELNLTEKQLLSLGFGFLVGLPLLFIITGLYIRFKRRKREIS